VADPVFRSPHFRIQTLGDGVFAAVATDEGYGLCNSGIVDLGDVAVVFDSMLTPQAGDDLRRAAETLTGRPVGYLVNSHYHGDHVRGNSAFPSVRIVSTRKVRELIEERAVRALAEDRAEVPAELERLRREPASYPPRDRAVFTGWFEGILATPVGTVIPGPEMFVEDRLVLRGPRREVWAMTFGGGHSPSDVIAFLPDEKVAFLGDLLSVGFHPGVGDGDPRTWVPILDAVRELGVDRALPGHGPVGGPPEIARLQRYLATLLDLAREAHRQGRSRTDLANVPVPAEFAEWVFAPFFPANVGRAFDLTAP
jgi:cyclase